MSQHATPRTQIHSLQVATQLQKFIETQVLPNTGVSSEKFWKGFDAIVQDLAPKNIALLAVTSLLILGLTLSTWRGLRHGHLLVAEK